jgi:peptide/nickel transport system ATP-binding protein
MSLVEIEHLSIRLPEQADRPWAIHELDLSLEAGELTCVVGRSGSGKSALAHAMLGLLPRELAVDRGAIRFDGRDLVGLPDKEWRGLRGAEIGMIFQEPMASLNPLMRIGEQLTEAFHVGRRAKREALESLLEEVDLAKVSSIADRYPFELSGGQRQRVMIAMALARRPRLLIADEPTTALDVVTQAKILKLIKKLQMERNLAVLFITHDFGVVAQIADKVAVLDDGHLVESGGVRQILEGRQKSATRALISAAKMALPHRPVSDSSGEAKLPLLAVSGLTHDFSRRESIFRKETTRVLNDVNFTISQGETLGIIGASGSGKSTIGRNILRLLRPTAGDILFRGENIARLNRAELQRFRPRLQMVFQDPASSLNPRIPVGQAIIRDIRRNFRISVDDAKRRVQDAFEQVSLQPDGIHRLPSQFSGGQKQRICLARALVLQPQLLVADEAVSALDVVTQQDVIRLLGDLQKTAGFSLIFITHDIKIASRICDNIIVVNGGQIIERGATEDVINNPKSEYTRELVHAASLVAKVNLPDDEAFQVASA